MYCMRNLLNQYTTYLPYVNTCSTNYKKIKLSQLSLQRYGMLSKHVFSLNVSNFILVLLINQLLIYVRT